MPVVTRSQTKKIAEPILPTSNLQDPNELNERQLKVIQKVENKLMQLRTIKKTLPKFAHDTRKRFQLRRQAGYDLGIIVNYLIPILEQKPENKQLIELIENHIKTIINELNAEWWNFNSTCWSILDRPDLWNVSCRRFNHGLLIKVL
jgi:hypothetical protein